MEQRLSIATEESGDADGTQAARGEETRAHSVLCDVHWVRLVCDEGHSLGGGALTNFKILLGEIRAERRWILSGTPAKETSDADGCSTLGGLLAFLGCSQRTEWPSISRRFLKKMPGSEAALVEFLQPLMVRQLKRKIEVPRPIRSTVLLGCSPGERLAYNTIVSFTRANLVLTGLEGADSGAGAEVSLLHHTNLKSARAAIDNIRQACNGGGKQVATLTSAFYNEARMWLADRYKAPSHAVERVVRFMNAAQEGHAVPCDKCQLPLLMLLVMPTCGHLCCPECVGAEGPNLERCPVCAEELPWVSYLQCEECEPSTFCTHDDKVRSTVELHPRDAFAWCQPGFDLAWAETLREAEARALAESFAKQRREEARRATAGRGTDTGSNATGASALALAPASTRADALSPPSATTGADERNGATAVKVSHTKAAHIIERLPSCAESNATRCLGGGKKLRRPRWAPWSKWPSTPSRGGSSISGHFLYLRFGDDAVAQFWGKYRNTELDKLLRSRALLALLRLSTAARHFVQQCAA